MMDSLTKTLEEVYIEIPTWNNGTWSSTMFLTRDEFREFVLSLFKEPGQYDFDETSFYFNEQGRLWTKNKTYCRYPDWTKDFRDYWDTEKEKCTKGVIFKHNDRTWYLPREYYMWINFLPIYNKEKKDFLFPDVWDSQYHMSLYETLAELHYQHASVVKKRQFGSEQPHSEPVLSEKGWYTMGDVKVGDKLWNPDGTITTVLHKIPNGVKDVYTFKFIDGRTVRCGIDHNWDVFDRSAQKRKVLTTKDFLTTGLLKSPVTVGGKTYNNYRYTIDSIEPLNFNHGKDPNINPYILGLIIGDGSCGGNTVGITTNDPFIKDKIADLIGEDYNLKEDLPSVKTTARRWMLTYKKRFDTIEKTKYKNGKFGINPLIRELKELRLQGTNCYTKFIPEQVLNASLEYRIQCMQGLMDSDGYVNSKGLDIHYTTCNFKLADDVAFLARSLGIKCVINDVVVKGITYKRVRMSGNIKIDLFLLPRKKARFDLRKDKHLFEATPIIDIIKEDYQEESSCIVVDNPNHLYITKDYTITHNSYFHCAKMINYVWFDKGPVVKMGASQEKFINAKGSWKFLNEYRSFLNKETAWYRPMNPGQVLMWQQQIEDTDDEGRSSLRGLKGSIQGVTFDSDPTNGVGGSTRFFFYEEAGVAPTMDITVEYLFPAMELGDIVTGLFAAAGSVGELDDCGPLKDMTYHPRKNKIYPVTSDLIDENRTVGEHGLFIPEHWSMPPYIDKYGNSLVEEAFNSLTRKYEEWKETLSPEIARLRISQHPRFLSEAFDYREDSLFPTHLVKLQKRKIQEKEYPLEFVDLMYDENQKIVVEKTNKFPISEFPYSMKAEDKSGAIVVWERPIKDAPWGSYYASIDPVSEGKAECINNLVYTPDGKKRIGDLKIGDYVMNPDGFPTKVIAIYPQGKKELYRVSFNDGFSILVCKEHLWSVNASDNDKHDFHVLSTSQLLDTNCVVSNKGIGRNKHKIYNTRTYYKKTNNQNRWKIPLTKPLTFNSVTVPLDAYFLGLLLGDGGISTRGIRFTTCDIELIDYIKTVLPQDITIKKCGKYDYRISTTKLRNSITNTLRSLNLQGCKSSNKFIPDIYLKASIKDRLHLLQGLMDTDGYAGNHGAEFYTISQSLAYNVVDLVQSLGGIAKIRKKITSSSTMKGVGYVYIVRVALPYPNVPFKLKRKIATYSHIKTFSRYISNIEYEKYDEAVCIQVENPNNLYVTEHAIVTHNTTTSKSLCSIYVYKNPIEVTQVRNGEPKTFLTRDMIVCAWCGRYDDINHTHNRLQKIIEWYNAWTVVESNVSLFIRHMIFHNKQKYLVPKDQMLFLKELSSNSNTYQDYGWKNTGTVFKAHMLSYLLEYCSEVIEEETKEDGQVVRRTYGIERIPDIMAMEEMLAYRDKVNVDRLVALTALIAFAKVQQSNIGFRKMVDNQDKDKLEINKKMTTLYKSPFRHVGSNNHSKLQSSRSPFKNIR